MAYRFINCRYILVFSGYETENSFEGPKWQLMTHNKYRFSLPDSNNGKIQGRLQVLSAKQYYNKII